MTYREEDIGMALVKAKLITPEAFQETLDLCRKTAKKVSKILVEKGLVTEVQVAKAMELCYRVPYVDLKEHRVEPDGLNLIPFHVAWEYQVLPISVKERHLTVAMADPEDVMAVDYLQNLTGYKIRVVFSDPEAIREAINTCYGQEEKQKKTSDVIFSSNAPEPVGPYSQAIRFEKLMFISGQIGITPSGEMAGNSVEIQAKQALENLKAILREGNSGLDKVLKTTLFLARMEDFKIVNEIYADYFKGRLPARSTIAVKELPKGALVEIEAIACIGT